MPYLKKVLLARHVISQDYVAEFRLVAGEAGRSRQPGAGGVRLYLDAAVGVGDHLLNGQHAVTRHLDKYPYIIHWLA